MAAKQGTLAQLSAQAEDAKRAVLSKAGASSWFSNLNTVCTIKSAPPRSPDVLELLALKSGWLYKRNEQHVWQARWCCVVPHMFLYYFDANNVHYGGTGGGSHLPNPNSKLQEEWNNALLNGMGNRKPHEKRLPFPLFHNNPGGGGGEETSPAEKDGELGGNSNEGSDKGNQNLQPAGIIDLECYTSIHRSSENERVLELAGDDQVNPDLRPFYFCCQPDDVEEWNSALLQNRHGAILDEVDAYKQVADGFAQQLQTLHADLDESKIRQEECEQELYRVRCQHEETLRNVYRVAEDCLMMEYNNNQRTNNPIIMEKRSEYGRNMETVKCQDMGIPATVNLLTEYIRTLEETIGTLHGNLQELENDVQKTGQVDQAEIELLQKQTEEAKAAHAAERDVLVQQLQQSQSATQLAKKELEDVQKDLSSTKMEMTMLGSQQRNKVANIQQHKKILKKEVIELRQKLDDATSEHGSLKHEYDKLKLQYDQEVSKSQLLSRYVEKMESQVQVQQNMMEMMSQAGGSVYVGGSGGMSVANRSLGSPKNINNINHVDHNTPHRRNKSIHSNVPDGVKKEEQDDNDNADDADDEDDDDNNIDFENAERMMLAPPLISSPRSARVPRRFVEEMDNKSHVSELTEDRTQREFAAYQSYFSDKKSNETRFRKREQEQKFLSSPRMKGPPSVIIGVKKEALNDSVEEENEELNEKTTALGTIDNQSRAGTIDNQSRPPTRRSDIPRGPPDSVSVSSADNTMDSTARKLSVAQRARLEADRQTTPVRLRLDSRSLSGLQRQNSGHKIVPDSPQGSKQGGLWRRMEEAVLGPRLSDDESYTSDTDSAGEKRDSVGVKRRPRRRHSMTNVGEKRGQQRRQSDEKKTPDSAASVSNLSLQERSQLQRDKQLRFLRDQGLIKDESDIKGGAGARESASVTSSTASPSRRSFSPKKRIHSDN